MAAAPKRNPPSPRTRAAQDPQGSLFREDFDRTLRFRGRFEVLLLSWRVLDGAARLPAQVYLWSIFVLNSCIVCWVGIYSIIDAHLMRDNAFSALVRAT